MRCEDIREQLVHFHYGEADAELRPAIEEHVGRCDRCAQELDALRSTLSLTRVVTAPPLPEEVRERLWARIEGKRAGAFEALWAIFTPMVLGVGTCLVSLYPLYHFHMLERMDPNVLILGAVVWASLYNSVFTSILHHARLRRLLEPQGDGAEGSATAGKVQEVEESRGVRIQAVIYGLLCAFTGLFWSAVAVLGPGATRTPRLDTALIMTALSVAVLGLVGLGIGAFERRHAYATSLLVASIYCALGTPALYMISHGQMVPGDIMVGVLAIMAICLVGTFVGMRLHQVPRIVPETGEEPL